MIKEIPAGQMRDKIQRFISKLQRQYKSVEKLMYNISKVDNNHIRLSTDGLLYNLLFDPSMSETPYLMKEVAEEMGQKFDSKSAWKSAWSAKNEFDKLLNDYGWESEPEGGGIITIYKIS